MNKALACDYESDTLIWLETQIELLRTRRFDLLDLDNLIDELDSMAKHDRRSVAHRMENVIMHLLKCQAQPDHITGSWLGTIREQRYQLGRKLADMPSLRNALDGYIHDNYPHAVARAADETGLPRSAFPADCPYTANQLLDTEFLP
jgi:hypothetical protein